MNDNQEGHSTLPRRATYGQLDWDLEINGNQVVKHTISVRLYNLDVAVPLLHDNIQIALTSGPSYRNFNSKVGNRDIQDSCTFDSDHNIFIVDLAELRSIASEQNPVSLDLGFEERGAIRRVGNLYFYEMGHIPKAFRSSSTLQMCLPITSSKVRSFLSHLMARLLRQPLPMAEPIGWTASPGKSPKHICRHFPSDQFEISRILYTPSRIDYKDAAISIICLLIAAGIGALISLAVTGGSTP